MLDVYAGIAHLHHEAPIVTADGRPSAQFEHTILITEDGAEILTLP